MACEISPTEVAALIAEVSRLLTVSAVPAFVSGLVLSPFVGYGLRVLLRLVRRHAFRARKVAV